MGRERELRERDGSHKRSRNYSRELRKCTPQDQISDADSDPFVTETCVTLAQHNYTHPIMHPPSTGAQHNYLDVTPGLEPRTTIQLQGNEMRPRAIHYADDTVLLFPRLPSLLCLLFYDAFSHHAYVFLFVAAVMATQEETEKQDEIGTQEEPVEYRL